MSIGVLLVYAWLATTVVFIFWRVVSNPINRIQNAAISGDIETVKRCLDSGVKPDIQQGGTVTPLCLAIAKGHKDIAEMLLDYGADIDQGLHEEDGVNPLLEAAIHKHEEIVESLLARGAKIGFHYAALQGNIDILREHLSKNVSVNSKRNRGMTPLHLAALGGHREAIELLLEHGADVNFDTPASETPLHHAVRQNHAEVVNLLIDRGADTERIGKLGAPLHTAVDQNNTSLADLLISKGADVNRHDVRVPTPLHLAAEEGNVEVAKLLLEKGAEVDARAALTLETPLHKAAKKGPLQMVELLIRYGADVNSKSSFGATPLSRARDNAEITSLLLRHGATDYGWVE